MKTFKHKFFGWLDADATRYINADGSEGAIMAVGATVAPGLTLSASVEIGPRANIGPRASIGPRAVIGYGASIGDDASIGDGASIGYGASIGDGAIIGDDASIGDGEWWISIGPQGSRNAMLTAVQKPGGLRWWVGCKTNITTENLLALVAETHGDTGHAADYLHVIAFVEAHPGRLRGATKSDSPCNTPEEPTEPGGC